MIFSRAWCRSLPWPGVSIKRNFLWTWFVGSLTERYLSDAAVFPTGREHWTAIGVWEVWVDACVPRSNCCAVSQSLRQKLEELTSVRRDVFPEPLGPIIRMEGRVVRPDARNTTEWRKRGIEITRRIAMTRPRGDGLRRACAQSLMPDIIVSISAFPEASRACCGSQNCRGWREEQMQGFGANCLEKRSLVQTPASSNSRPTQPRLPP